MHSENLQSLHENSIDIERREIYLAGDDEKCNEIDGNSFAVFFKNLNLLNSISSEPIVLYSWLYGGDSSLGLGIYDLIKLSSSPVIFVAVGVCYSAATIIMQACDVRLITQNCSFMVHSPSMALEESDSGAATANVQSLRQQTDIFYNLYTERCLKAPYFEGKTKGVVKTFIKKKINKYKDWYLTAEEVVRYGFADKILLEKSTLDELRKEILVQRCITI